MIEGQAALPVRIHPRERRERLAGAARVEQACVPLKGSRDWTPPHWPLCYAPRIEKCARKDSNFQRADFESAASTRRATRALRPQSARGGIRTRTEFFLREPPLPVGPHAPAGSWCWRWDLNPHRARVLTAFSAPRVRPFPPLQPKSADEEIRTLTDQLLRLTPLPLGYVGGKMVWLREKDSNPQLRVQSPA